MIEMVTAGGKKVGELSDEYGQDDTLIVHGKKVDLEDVYNSKDLSDTFNSQVKDLKDDSEPDTDTTGDSE